MRASLTSQPRIGRFAPSPTGPLHFGSLVAAVASYLEARGGQWLLRIEDVDRPRAVAGMAALQQEVLQAYGFEWDGAVIQQSDRAALYDAALTKLVAANLAYPCTCSRSALAALESVCVPTLAASAPRPVVAESLWPKPQTRLRKR